MKKAIFILLAGLLTIAPLLAQDQGTEIVLDSAAYVFENGAWFKLRYVTFADGGFDNKKSKLVCGDPPVPCDTSQVTDALSNESTNAWVEWAGYKATAAARKALARAIQKDVAAFFQSVMGPANASTVHQNTKHIGVLGGVYRVTTPEIPGVLYTLSQEVDGTCRLSLNSDPAIFMTASLSSDASFRFNEKLHARGVMVVTNFNNLSGDIVTVAGINLTEGVDFLAVTNANTSATNLAAAINAIPNIQATAYANVVTVTADAPGNTGNSIAMSYQQGAGNGLTLSGNSLAGGSNGTTTRHDVGFGRLNDAGKRIYLNDGESVKLVKQ